MLAVGPNQVPMCLDCREKLGRVLAQQNDQIEREINYLTDQIEAVTGVPGLPRYRVRQPAVAVRAAAPITFSNINVNNSNIGVINTGTIIGSSISVLNSRPESVDLAKAIQALVIAIEKSTLEQQVRMQSMEIVSQVAEEATKPEHQRRGGVIRPLLGSLATFVQASAAVSQIWETYGPTIRAWFKL